MSTPKRTRLNDVGSLRAYAHPLRMQIVSILRGRGPHTATQLAAELGESSGSTSYHLRQLARYGIVEESPGGKGREKPWQAAARITSIPDSEPTEEMAEAATELRLTLARRWHDQLADWIVRRTGEPKRWRKAPFNDHGIWVTAAELAELDKKINALIDPYMLGRDEQNKPRGARFVMYVNYAMPR